MAKVLLLCRLYLTCLRQARCRQRSAFWSRFALLPADCYVTEAWRKPRACTGVRTHVRVTPRSLMPSVLVAVELHVLEVTSACLVTGDRSNLSNQKVPQQICLCRHRCTMFMATSRTPSAGERAACKCASIYLKTGKIMPFKAPPSQRAVAQAQSYTRPCLG